MRLFIASLVLLFASTIHFAQDSQRASLYAFKCKTGVSLCGTQEIVRYDFQDGELKLRTVVFSSDDIRFDVGHNQLVNGNILLNQWGDVIDLRAGRVLSHQSGDFVGIIGTTAVFDSDNEKDNDLYTFNIKTHVRKKIKSTKDIEDLDQVTSEFSPSGRLVAKWKQGHSLRSVFEFFSINEVLSVRKIRIVSGDFSASCSTICNDLNRTPFGWIDESRIITQRKNGELVTVDVTGRVRPVLTINIDDEPDSLPSFGRDHDGNVFYRCGGKSYLIDVKNKTFSTKRLPLGSGFAATDSDTFLTEYFYNGDSIGNVWSGGALATTNYLAVLYAKDGKNLGYPDGFKVWSRLTRKWVTIDDSPFFHLIGWGER
jgi:hypothetical protein